MNFQKLKSEAEQETKISTPVRKCRKNSCTSTPATTHSDFVQVAKKKKNRKRKIKGELMQEYLGISVASGRKMRSGGNRRQHSESHRSQRGAADAAGEKGFGRQNKFQNPDFPHSATH